MSGHSKWETTKRQKAVVDAKRGAVFTKLGNMIAIAARKGTDPDMNPALALAIDKAKHANMPASNIQRAIDRVSDKNASALEEIVYEAYGPGGIGIIIETATDNRNRTLPEVRTTLTKNGGTIADPGSVAFQFDHKGVIHVEATGDEALMTILDAGAEDATDDGKEITAITDMRDLHQVRQAIVDAGLTVADAGLEYVGKTQVEVNDPDKAARAMRLLNALDDLDDVTGVHTNADITAEV
ncbi:YebC/PmpR family DNA-binding transcriptional regulator [Candidatus Saccharibacteria bacterium]|jgi:YebC/PmpR family DNA-binding regulatory protein|nr:YebC/PmpR family DNA-binding transcriptional regulator [Candidatus Saccharibacteria bacterium]